MQENFKVLILSFDIESLFTILPLQETIELCVENLFKDGTHVGNLSKDSFCELLTMPESLILFDQEFYKQHDGVVMVSPLGPTDVVMEKFEFNIVLLNLNLLAIEATLMINSYFFARNTTFRNYLNRQHKIITFTSEIENENSISFLDIKIRRDNNTFTNSVYYKPTFSGVCTNFGSFIPKSYKFNLLFTLLHVALTVCSNFVKFFIRKLSS